MAKADFKGALKTEKIDSFGGISLIRTSKSKKKDSGSFSANDICNFRILPGGEIEKREGFEPILTLPGEPRAIKCGTIDGRDYFYAIVDKYVYSVDTESGACTSIGAINTSLYDAEIFFYKGSLYITDGDELYTIESNRLKIVNGYIPLYGKNVDGRPHAPIFEDINFLSDKIRISYLTTEVINNFEIGVKCNELLAFYVNGVDFLNNVELDETGKVIKCIGVNVIKGTNIEAVLRLDPEVNNRRYLTTTHHGTAYGGCDDGRMLLYGSRDFSRIFVSKPVSSRSLAESKKADPASDDLYFPISDTAYVSYGQYPITALCRHYDRLLLFTEKETWVADFTQGSALPYIVPVNSSIGCTSKNGAALGGNTPYSVSENGIYMWTSETDSRNECNAVCISDEISPRINSDFFKRATAFYNRSRDEVWFADPESDTQEVWVYARHSGKWCRFEGIPADMFFDLGGRIAMLYGKYILAFSSDLCEDIGIGGKVKSPIEASYTSNQSDFGFSERKKHLKRALAICSVRSDTVKLIFEGDKGGKKVIQMDESHSNGGNYPTHLDARIDIGRFREMHYTISAAGKGRAKISSLILSATK